MDSTLGFSDNRDVVVARASPCATAGPAVKAMKFADTDIAAIVVRAVMVLINCPVFPLKPIPADVQRPA